MTKKSATEHGSDPRCSISDIVKIWDEQGWKGLDQLAGQARARTCYHKGYERDTVSFVFDGLERWLVDQTFGDELFGDTMTEGEFILECVANPSDDRYYTPLAQDGTERLTTQIEIARRYGAETDAAKAKECMREALKKILTAFTICPDKEHLISTLLPPALAKTYCYELFGDTPVPCWEHFGPWPITDEDKGIATWLLDVLNDKTSCREAYWNCVWTAGQDVVHTLLDILHRIGRKVPATNEQMSTLSQLVDWQYPHSYWRLATDGSSVSILDAPCETGLAPCTSRSLDELLTEPARMLLDELKKACLPSSFVQTCHAPSCDERFYVGDKRTIACKRRSRGENKSECQLEWRRYKQWLERNGSNPETDWDTPELKKQFLAKDKPYYRKND